MTSEAALHDMRYAPGALLGAILVLMLIVKFR
jgi:hypothetical protein